MIDEVESKIYELGYHLAPDIEETNVKLRAQEVSDLITRGDGSVLSSREPKYVHLSYPIRQKQHGYFGTFDFTAPPEAIEKIDAQMKLRDDILRFLIIKKIGGGEVRILGEHKGRHLKTRLQRHATQTKETQIPKREEKIGEKIKTEEIEKEIEEVIKGL